MAPSLSSPCLPDSGCQMSHVSPEKVASGTTTWAQAIFSFTVNAHCTYEAPTRSTTSTRKFYSLSRFDVTWLPSQKKKTFSNKQFRNQNVHLYFRNFGSQLGINNRVRVPSCVVYRPSNSLLVDMSPWVVSLFTAVPRKVCQRGSVVITS